MQLLLLLVETIRNSPNQSTKYLLSIRPSYIKYYNNNTTTSSAQQQPSQQQSNNSIYFYPLSFSIDLLFVFVLIHPTRVAGYQHHTQQTHTRTNFTNIFIFFNIFQLQKCCSVPILIILHNERYFCVYTYKNKYAPCCKLYRDKIDNFTV